MKKITSLIVNIITFSFEILYAYFYDMARFVKYSTTSSTDALPLLEGRIMANAHVIEKGLSLKNTKILFGKIVIQNLISLLEKYIKNKYPKDNFAFQSGISALESYSNFHKKQNIETINVDNFLRKYKKYLNHKSSTIKINSKNIKNKTNKNFKSLVESRHTVRNFSEKPVSINLIKMAIEIALKTPSVCNRQSWKVHLLTNKKIINKALLYQNGNRGFAKQINKLIIVSASLNSFQGVNERNQVYIDGGLFSMSLIYSLHSKNIAVCPLNWASSVKNDINLKKTLKIPHDETIILMLALGSMNDEFLVARSRRKKITETLTIHK